MKQFKMRDRSDGCGESWLKGWIVCHAQGESTNKKKVATHRTSKDSKSQVLF